MQFKRNEIKIETLKRSHKKEIIIGVLGVIAIVATITMTTSKAKYRTTQVLPLVEGEITYTPYDFKIMAMYKSDDGVNYTEITDRMPSSGYVINESKSYCTIDNVNHDTEVVLKTVDGNHVFNNLTKLDKCYIWFDKEKTGSDIILANITVNSGTPTFSNVATTDEGVFKTSDGMYGGTTYYWRGASTTNHVIFANKCWRIVRINGDKTMRLIYNGDIQSGNTCTGNGKNSGAVIIGSTNAEKYYATSDGKYDNPSYSGWTFTLSTQRTLSGTSSNTKTQTEKWYSSNITGTNAEKVADGKFCNDRNVGIPPTKWNWSSSNYVTSWSAWQSNTGKWFAYAGAKRLVEDYSPTFSCNSGDTYTLKVGAITADEVEFAGGKDAYNASYYMYTGQRYWTMSPWGWDSGYARVFIVDPSGYLCGDNVGDYVIGLRPVINLRSDITFKSGSNGTQTSPYIVE